MLGSIHPLLVQNKVPTHRHSNTPDTDNQMVHLIELIEDKHRSDSKKVVPHREDAEADKLTMWEVCIFEGDKFVEGKDVENEKYLIDNHGNERANIKKFFENSETYEI